MILLKPERYRVHEQILAPVECWCYLNNITMYFFILNKHMVYYKLVLLTTFLKCSKTIENLYVVHHPSTVFGQSN